MQVLLREQLHHATGQVEVRDREWEGVEITIGSGPDCVIQIIGPESRPLHATLTGHDVRTGSGAGDGLHLQCFKDARVVMSGESVTGAELAVGDAISVGGSLLTLIAPPAGFDIGIELIRNEDIDPGAFESAFTTDLSQTWLSKRAPSWWLAGLVLMLGLVVPLLGLELAPWWASDAVWSSGPLHPAHAVAIGDDCGACHVKPFQRVRDEVCTTCHVNLADHTEPPLHAQAGLAGERCASCHKEHNEPAHITISDDDLCTACHEEPTWPENRLAGVSGFSASDHPEFSADLLAPRALPKGTGLGYEWSVDSKSLDAAVDASNLKYPHDLHMDAAKVQDMMTGAALTCAHCHALQADDEHFAPTTMEAHCRSCHDLKFDRRAPHRELPHGNPAEVLLTMEGHYMRLYSDPNFGEADANRRRLPDRATSTDRCDDVPYVCAKSRTLREAETQFTRRGCITCHQVAVHDSEDLLARFQVVPVRLNGDYFRAASFNHRAHLTQEGASGDAACLSCHPADRSAASEDVMIPGLDNCLGCHGDHRQDDLVELHCIHCHEFHPTKTGASPSR